MARFIATFLLVVSFVTAASSQTATGTVLGLVVDDKGAALPGAQVTAIDEDKDFRRGPILSNDSGRYSFPDLPAGNYRIEVELKGFKKYILTDVIVEVDRRGAWELP